MRILIPLMFLPLAACQPDPFDQVGYFKDAGPNRTFILHATETVTADQVRNKVERLSHTAGQTTIAYVFTADAIPRDHVTLAADFMAAQNAMFDVDGPAWRWRYIRSPNSAPVLIDCAGMPGDDGNCRP